ncbi:hypothetical protein BJV82DRAFT_511228 [Fennellomyces sp. T-0311]|nr:hypothetical protein BJV82DRAFT_511228 [Fennellomyces sp. T-0311]
MANDFPKPMFYCLDMREQPNLQDILHIPPNTHFEKANILHGLNHTENSFDFCHQRMMLSAYHGEDVAYVIREMHRLLKPGGWLEMVEYDPIPKRAGPLFTKLTDTLIAFLKSRHKYLITGPKLRRFLKEGNFQEIQYDYASIPVCWGGYVGKHMYENILTGMRYVGPLIYKELFNTEAEFDEAEYDEFVDKAFDECVQYQTFLNVHWAYGKKASTVH